MAKSPLIKCQNKPWFPAQKPFLTKACLSALVNLTLNIYLLFICPKGAAPQMLTQMLLSSTCMIYI